MKTHYCRVTGQQGISLKRLLFFLRALDASTSSIRLIMNRIDYGNDKPYLVELWVKDEQ